MRHSGPEDLTFEQALMRMRSLVHCAKQAAARGDWRENHRFCREHDDLAMAVQPWSRVA